MAEFGDSEKAAERRAAILSGETGVVKSDSKYSGSVEGANPVRIGSNVRPDAQLGAAIADYFKKSKGNAFSASMNDEGEFESSVAVLKALKEGKIKKSEAISYVEKFNLVTADKIDELTPSNAIKLLEADADEELVHAEVISQVVKPTETYVSNGDQLKNMDQPTPDGSVNVKDQLGNSVSKPESTVNTAKPEANQPKPSGTVSPENMRAHPEPNDSTVNTAKPEDSQPNPKKVGEKKTVADNTPPHVNGAPSSDVNTAKPEDKQPSPDGSVSVKDQLGNTVKKPESTVNTAKPEGQPTVTKAQMDGLGLPPMPKGDGPKDMDMPKDDISDLKHDEHMDKKDEKRDVTDEVKEALELLKKVQDLMKDIKLEFPEIKEKKEHKPKDGGDGEPKSEKSEKPEGEKKEPKEPKDAPKMPDLPKEKDPMPMMAAYKLELIADKKSPVDSYYIVNHNDKPLFSISAKQCYAKNLKEAAATDLTVEQFNSNDYAKELTSELNKTGARKVFNEIFSGKGIILAQQMAPNTLPDAPAPVKDAPAKDMNTTPEVAQELGSNETQKQDFMEVFLDELAAIISGMKGVTAQEVMDSLRATFSDEVKSKEFEGRLFQKTEDKAKEVKHEETPAGGIGAPSPEANEAMPKPEEVKAMRVMIASFKEALPEIKKAIQERDEYKAQLDKVNSDRVLKARVNKTIKIAEQKADAGVIDGNDVQEEAVRLAKLSDEKLSEEVRIFEDSVKIANKKLANKDCINTEGNKVSVVKGTVLASIPSQEEPTTITKTISWSKGVMNRK